MILHTIPGIYEEASGPTYTVPRLCEALLSIGVPSRVVTLDYGMLPPSMTYARTFRIGLGPGKLGRSPAMWRHIAESCESGSVQILHNHSLWMMPNVYPGWAAKRFEVPYVVSPRGVFTEYALSIGSRLKPIFWKLVQQPSLAAVSCFHATAESEYLDIRRLGYKQPVAIVPNGIDVPDETAQFDSPSRTLLFLGRLHPNKGLELLLSAWSQVASAIPDWRLRIVGSGDSDYVASLRGISDSLKTGRVEFSGALYGAEKFMAYREADCYILPSLSENFGVTVAEALASGLPAIVTKGAPWEQLDRFGAGRWVDGSIDALAAAILELCSKDRDALRLMGFAGRSWMQRDFSWDSIAHKTNEVYLWLTGGGDVPSCVRTS